MASLIVTYLLWLFGGIFGAHHFYLQRDRQAFVWIATLGGVCGLGWLRDIWHIPRYVRECARQYNTLDSDSFVSDTNNEYDYMYSRESDDDDVNYEFVRVGQGGFDTVWTTQARGRVKVSLARYAVMFVMGLNFGSLVTMLCPQSWLQSQRIQSIFDSFISPIAVALGVDIVANIGRLQAKFDWSLAGAYAGVFCCKMLGQPGEIIVLAITSTVATGYLGLSRKPASSRHRQRTLKRLARLLLLGTVYWLLWGSAIYYNGTISTEGGKEMPVRDVVDRFLDSPEWAEIKEVWKHWWHKCKVWFTSIFEEREETRKGKKEEEKKRRRYKQEEERERWRRETQSRSNPSRKLDPYEVLGVSRSASLQEIKARYRELVLLWHPDKQADPLKRTDAHVRFMEIQNAYETLTKRFRA